MKKQRNTALRAVTAAFALAITAGLVSTTPAMASAPAPANTASRLTAGSLRIGLSSNGTVTSLVDTANGHDYASTDHPEPLIKLVADGDQQLPTAVSYDKCASTYTFTFGAKGIKVGVKADSKNGYATLEVTSVDAPKGVDVQTLLWGPLTTTITQTIGETVGVVRDNDFAIGIHGLNDKSVGGWPTEDNDLSFPDGPTKVGVSDWPFGWFSASQTDWGSVLQAYTYDYTKARTRNPGWNNITSQDVPALTGDDAQIKGSKIALFGTAPGNVVTTLSGIETGEHLIHPLVDGQWEKTSQGASQSFLVLNDLNTGNAAQASALAKAAGIRTVYSLPNSEGPWQSTGHYDFDGSFGGSDTRAAGLAATAATNGVSVGVHTLSNTVDTWDPYVKSDPQGLATQGTVKLTRPLDASSRTVYVDGDSPFNGGNGNALRIGNELISYGAVTKVAGSANEYQIHLNGRGGWGTKAAAHAAGDDLARMTWYAYDQFDAGMTMLPALSDRLAQIFNTTGIKAMSFDGLETATLTGYGTFATNKLVNGMYRGITDTDNFVSEASNLLPGTWDATTRVSWGEGAHGNTYTGSLLAHQAYYQRNYMPDMMGWVVYNNSDTVLTQEWQLSKMAAWNAGAGLQTSVGALKSSGNTAGVLEAWKQWEAARNAHAFTQAQMDAMKDADSYWHLENTVPGKEWNLYDVDYAKTPVTAPSGNTTSWTYSNTHQAQALQFQLLAANGDVTNPSFTVGGQTVTYPVTVPHGDTLVADATGTAKVYDHTQHVLKTVAPQGSVSLAAGDQTISYHATGDNSNSQIHLITYGAAQKVTAPITADAPATAAPGSANTVTSSYTNHGTDKLKDVQLTLAAPKGWTAVATSHTTFATVKPGQTVTATWTVTPPADAKLGDYNLPVQATYQDLPQYSPEAIAQLTLAAPAPTATATEPGLFLNRGQSGPGA
ncbi:NEW3 domain-containing protein [Kitasatospora viridis]|uniref:Alpha-galactosidase-like protein n=1 Tax=Kitasatospora viridis TaxID=281105 RepID=A0A561TSI7_9ACTN|nr:NEW3 domain-containing protein [Kitasatospora viridis]TWF90068.1 alpha-galactosidase-like protein [Kitasatospora viridis]